MPYGANLLPGSRPFPGCTSPTVTSNPLGILSSRGGRIREAPSAGRTPELTLIIAYQISIVKNYFELVAPGPRFGPAAVPAARVLAVPQ